MMNGSLYCRLSEDIEKLSTIFLGIETYLPANYEIGENRKRACVAVILLIAIMNEINDDEVILLVFWLLISKYLPLRFKHHCLDAVKMSPDKMQDIFKDENSTAIAEVFGRKIDASEISKFSTHNINKLRLSSYIQEFQKETLSKWTCKLEKFVKTRAADAILHHAKTQNVIHIAGPTGAGKSILAYHSAFKLKEEGNYTIVPVRKTEDFINCYIPDTKQIFIIDDFIGRYSVDETDAVAWVKNGPIFKIIFSENNQSKIILTSRTYIWQAERYKYSNLQSYTCDLLSEDLQLLPEERRDICKSYINTDGTMALDKEEIMMYNNFPSVCAMYPSSKKFIKKHFLNILFLIIEDEINNFKINSQVRFMALAILAIKQMISKTSLTIDNDEHDKLLQDLFHESTFPQYQSKNLLMSTLADFKGEYVRECHNCFVFIDETMQKIVLCCLTKTFMKSVIKYCKIDVILNHFRLYCINEEHDVLSIKVTRENKNAYFQRLVNELNNGFHKDVLESAQNVCPQFRVKFLEYMKHHISRNKLTEIQEGKTALHVVSALGYQEYVLFFVRDKHMINNRDNDGNIPLHLACMNGHFKIVKDLIENNSSVDISNKMELKPFWYACENGSINIVKHMLHYTAKSITVNDKYRQMNKRCVLHVVCENGYSNLAVLLLQKNAEVDAKDADGCTPLHLACHKGHSGTVAALLNYKANVDVIDSFGKTSVYMACRGNHTRVLELLLNKKSVVNSKNEFGLTPLCVSCKNGNIIIVEMLLRNGAKVNSPKPSVVPLHKACTLGNESIVNILIESKASVNQTTKEGITPLHEACMNGHEHVIKILLAKQAKVNKADKHGWTALFFSSANGFPTICDLLLKNGAFLNMCDEDQINPLMIACKENKTDVVDLLLRSKADVNHCDKDNSSSLAFACKTGNIAVVNLLLKYSADINLSDKDMASPLHTACMNNKRDIVLILINNNANVNAKDKFEQTPLFKSSVNGYIEIVKILLNHGASVNICDTAGMSPMATADKNGHIHVADVIRQYTQNI